MGNTVTMLSTEELTSLSDVDFENCAGLFGQVEAFTQEQWIALATKAVTVSSVIKHTSL